MAELNEDQPVNYELIDLAAHHHKDNVWIYFAKIVNTGEVRRERLTELIGQSLPFTANIIIGVESFALGTARDVHKIGHPQKIHVATAEFVFVSRQGSTYMDHGVELG